MTEVARSEIDPEDDHEYSRRYSSWTTEILFRSTSEWDQLQEGLGETAHFPASVVVSF